jgi:hypothetical protein
LFSELILSENNSFLSTPMYFNWLTSQPLCPFFVHYRNENIDICGDFGALLPAVSWCEQGLDKIGLRGLSVQSAHLCALGPTFHLLFQHVQIHRLANCSGWLLPANWNLHATFRSKT